MMGALRGIEFPAQSCHIPTGARLPIFSDSVFEIFRERREMWNLARCIAHLTVLGEREGSVMDEQLNHLQGQHCLGQTVVLPSLCFFILRRNDRLKNLSA
jgi:hypothetical protein